MNQHRSLRAGCRNAAPFATNGSGNSSFPPRCARCGRLSAASAPKYRAGRSMPKRPRDDSTGAVGKLGTRFHRQRFGMAVDAAFGDGVAEFCSRITSLASWPRHREYAVRLLRFSPEGSQKLAGGQRSATAGKEPTIARILKGCRNDAWEDLIATSRNPAYRRDAISCGGTGSGGAPLGGDHRLMSDVPPGRIAECRDPVDIRFGNEAPPDLARSAAQCRSVTISPHRVGGDLGGLLLL